MFRFKVVLSHVKGEPPVILRSAAVQSQPGCVLGHPREISLLNKMLVVFASTAKICAPGAAQSSGRTHSLIKSTWQTHFIDIQKRYTHRYWSMFM